MAFASLSAEVRGASIMRDLGVSAAFVSGLTGIEKTKLTLALRQIKELPGEEGRLLVETLLRLSAVSEAIAPFLLDTKNPANARVFLDALHGMDASEIRKKVSAIFGREGE